MSRLLPLPEPAWDDDVRASLAGFLPQERRNPRAAGNALATLVRHPQLTRPFLRFNAHLLLTSTLPAHLRETVILRVAKRRGCAYEWAHHSTMAAAAGLSEAEIEAAGRGEAVGDLERAALRAVVELDEDSEISDGTWAALSEHLDERQLMDLIFTVGTYTLLAMAFNSFGVELEHER
jgi:4-carboxymuconolactone decarboxylase